jgi:hypothetical protein
MRQIEYNFVHLYKSDGETRRKKFEEQKTFSFSLLSLVLLLSSRRFRIEFPKEQALFSSSSGFDFLLAL